MKKSVVVQEEEKKIGSIIRRMRNARGLSMKQLAKKTAVTHQQISKYEAGTNRIAVTRFRELCRAMKLDYIQCLEAEDEMFEVPSREMLEMMQAYTALPRDVRLPIREMIRKMGELL